MLARVRQAGRPAADVVRDAFAVMFEWTALSRRALGLPRIQYARLLEPVYAFHGQTSPVAGKRAPLAYPGENQQPFPGGACQVLIPNITGEHLKGDGICLLT